MKTFKEYLEEKLPLGMKVMAGAALAYHAYDLFRKRKKPVKIKVKKSEPQTSA